MFWTLKIITGNERDWREDIWKITKSKLTETTIIYIYDLIFNGKFYC